MVAQGMLLSLGLLLHQSAPHIWLRDGLKEVRSLLQLQCLGLDLSIALVILTIALLSLRNSLHVRLHIDNYILIEFKVELLLFEIMNLIYFV
jgi:hypothetical protein